MKNKITPTVFVGKAEDGIEEEIKYNLCSEDIFYALIDVVIVTDDGKTLKVTNPLEVIKQLLNNDVKIMSYPLHKTEIEETLPHVLRSDIRYMNYG